jgi:hypothetical protein
MLKITNREISRKLTNRNRKHDDVEAIKKSVAEIALRHQEIDEWNGKTAAQKNDYFLRCQTAAYQKERAVKYKQIHELEAYEDLHESLTGKNFETMEFSRNSDYKAAQTVNTAISLAKRAALAEVELVQSRELLVPESEITARAERFRREREAAMQTGEWEVFNRG